MAAWISDMVLFFFKQVFFWLMQDYQKLLKVSDGWPVEFGMCKGSSLD